jgi:hypothetical protein
MRYEQVRVVLHLNGDASHYETWGGQSHFGEKS